VVEVGRSTGQRRRSEAVVWKNVYPRVGLGPVQYTQGIGAPDPSKSKLVEMTGQITSGKI